MRVAQSHDDDYNDDVIHKMILVHHELLQITIIHVAALRLFLCEDQTRKERQTVVGTHPDLWAQTMMAVLKLSTKSATTPAAMATLPCGN